MAFNQAGNKILLIKKYFAKWKGNFFEETRSRHEQFEIKQKVYDCLSR